MDIMTEIDHLFAASLEKIIKKNLGETTFLSIQNRLFEKIWHINYRIHERV